MTITVNISIDVPDLAAGLDFYGKAFGFVERSRPFPGLAVIDAGNLSICLLEREEGSKSSPTSDDARRYTRHWTPVHMDLHVDEFRATLDRALEAGARLEQLHENPEHGAAAFCSDPFGHGICLIERVDKHD